LIISPSFQLGLKKKTKSKTLDTENESFRGPLTQEKILEDLETNLSFDSLDDPKLAGYLEGKALNGQPFDFTM